MWRHPSSLSFILTRMASGGSSVSPLGSTPFRTGVALDGFAVSVFSNQERNYHVICTSLVRKSSLFGEGTFFNYSRHFGV